MYRASHQLAKANGIACRHKLVQICSPGRATYGTVRPLCLPTSRVCDNICARCGDCRLPFALTRVVGFGLKVTGDSQRKCIWLWLEWHRNTYSHIHLADSSLPLPLFLTRYLGCAFCLNCGNRVWCGWLAVAHTRGLIERLSWP